MSNAKCLKEITFNSKPWGITKVSDHKVAVTFPDERKIRLITFSEEMEVLDTTEIPGHGRCFGIAYSYEHLVVSHYLKCPGSVKILNMSGEIVKSFDKDDDSQDLLKVPLYLALSPDNTMIYVSDQYRNTVTCLNFDGKVTAIYKDDQLNYPYQLAVDEYGSVYVCGHYSNNVHQLSCDLTKVKILLDKSHDILRSTSIAYCLNTKRLFVEMNYNKKIKVFGVSLE
jgi:DNA-binding beta-propeller fold protein YncE